jgi:hypothetical protein
VSTIFAIQHVLIISLLYIFKPLNFEYFKNDNEKANEVPPPLLPPQSDEVVGKPILCPELLPPQSDEVVGKPILCPELLPPQSDEVVGKPILCPELLPTPEVPPQDDEDTEGEKFVLL